MANVKLAACIVFEFLLNGFLFCPARYQTLFLTSLLGISEESRVNDAVPSPAFHSARSAVIGSTFIARRAGRKLASSATPAKNSAIDAKVIGSAVLTP
jgi:hypothetical protein